MSWCHFMPCGMPSIIIWTKLFKNYILRRIIANFLRAQLIYLTLCLLFFNASDNAVNPLPVCRYSSGPLG